MLLSSAAYFALFVGLHATDHRPWVGVAVAAVAVAAIGLVLLRPFVRSALLDYLARPSVDRLVDVEFRQKPNVYLVGFDGMIPAALLGRLGMESAQGTPFHELMSRRFRVFRNFFTNDVGTVQSYNTLLSLDERVKVLLPDRSTPLFSGTQDSPLYRLFRRNGYEITTLYMDKYLGASGGAYVSNHIITKQDLVCGQLDRSLRSLSFYGYCDFRAWWADPAAASVVARLRNLPSSVKRRDLTPQSSYVANQRLVDHILQASDLEQPQLVLAHIFHPGHAGRFIDLRNEDNVADFRAWYIPEFTYAAGLLAQIVDHLEAHDPSAILFVFGDHGPFLTFGRDGWGGGVDYGWPLLITDQFGTVGGTFPPERCSPYLRTPAGRKGDYMTTLDVMHGILRCLSGGRWATKVLRASRRTIRYDQPYEDFLYE